jgi:hypothetical protein
MLQLAVVYAFCTANRTLASRLHMFARELALRYQLARGPLWASRTTAARGPKREQAEYLLHTAVRLTHGKCTPKTDSCIRSVRCYL